MASRLNALRQQAMEVGSQLSEGLAQKAAQLAKEQKTRSFATYALVAVSGFTIGILTGLLVAPSSGYETRNRISERATGVVSSIQKLAKRKEKEALEEAERIA